MKEALLALLGVALPAFAGLPVFARVESVPSSHLPAAVRVVVMTPPSYGAVPGRRYPVLYFLHDAGGDEEILFREGVAASLRGGMKAGTLPEMLVVAPRGVGTWFVDSFDGRSRYATFLTDELVPFVDGRYPTRAERGSRLVAGISMGGYGALRWALLRPELFAAAGGLSPAIQTMTWRAVSTMPFFVRWSLKRVFGRSALENSLRENDLYDILLSRPELARAAPRVLLRCGTEDRYRLAEISRFFGAYLDAMGIPNEVVVEPGNHDWAYWKRSLPELIGSLAGRPGGTG